MHLEFDFFFVVFVFFFWKKDRKAILPIRSGKFMSNSFVLLLAKVTELTTSL